MKIIGPFEWVKNIFQETFRDFLYLLAWKMRGMAMSEAFLIAIGQNHECSVLGFLFGTSSQNRTQKNANRHSERQAPGEAMPWARKESGLLRDTRFWYSLRRDHARIQYPKMGPQERRAN
jgi:hypothetical protein